MLQQYMNLKLVCLEGTQSVQCAHCKSGPSLLCPLGYVRAMCLVLFMLYVAHICGLFVLFVSSAVSMGFAMTDNLIGGERRRRWL